MLKLSQNGPIFDFIIRLMLSLAVGFDSKTSQVICHRTNHIPLRHIGRVLRLALKAHGQLGQHHLRSCKNTLLALDDFDFAFLVLTLLRTRHYLTGYLRVTRS